MIKSLLMAARKDDFDQAETAFKEVFGLNRAGEILVFAFIGLAFGLAFFWFFHSAPPKVLTITSGPDGSMFRRHAEKYRDILKRSGVRLLILPSEGSIQNLSRLADPSFKVDVGFVQGGISAGFNTDDLVSLGSLYHEPLLIFYRRPRPAALLSALSGKRLAIGPAGSGTHALALALLAANGIKPGGTTKFVEMEAEDGAQAVLSGKADAVFLTGDSTKIETVRRLLRAPGVRLYDSAQADAYVRRFNYLNKMELPRGSLDLGKDIPPHDVTLIGPTVELVARSHLHPALSDLLLEAARETHGGAGLFRRQGEFPAPQEHEFRLSPYAARFYKSGKTFFYRFLPFALASLVDRVLVIFVPLLVVLIPAFKMVPALYRLRMNLRIYRWYRALLKLEREVASDAGMPEREREAIMGRLDHMERAVNRLKVPAPFAGQFYELRGHIGFVRGQLASRHSG